MRGLRTLFRLLACAVMLLPVCGEGQAAQAALEPEFLMDSDPPLQLPQPTKEYHPRLKALWLEALDRPEVDLQRMAAETIARAHRLGMPGLADAIPRLEQLLVDEKSHPAARFAAARALITLEARSSSEHLLRVAQQYGAEFGQLIEPALAEWDYAPARTLWIQRLDSDDTRHHELILALRGLGRVGEPSVLSLLVSMARDPLWEPDIRLEAATAAGRIADSGLETEAARLADGARSQTPINSLCALRLLARHSTDATRELLTRLARHENSAVAATALHRLNEIDPALVVPLAESAIQSTDPQVRREAAAAYLSIPAAEHIPPLAGLLADPHPDIRREVCAGLLKLSENSELAEPIRAAAMDVLAGDQWQGQEQAALLLGTLEHKPAANRLVELLESPRREVMVTAAWALRKVAVAETAPAILDKARRQTELRQRMEVPGLDEQVAHLFEALGVLNATEAEPLLREYIPKRFAMGERSRSAAIRTLAQMKAGVRDPVLEGELLERLSDFADQRPELPAIKAACAVALARMQAVDLAPMIRDIALNYPLPIKYRVTLQWAVQELTGEELTLPDPPPVQQPEWFLEPLP